MIRIAALNDSSSDDEEENGFSCGFTTKEAQEAEAFSIYNKGLGLQRQGDVDGAERVLKSLLNASLVTEVKVKDDDEETNLLHPGALLKYSVHKNLASIAAQKGDYNKAMVSYLEAVNVDSSDVTLWHKIGTVAMKLDNYQLAKMAFMQGLSCNPNHWPCLDHAITVFYALNNYTNCLCYIGQALERDSGYMKGLAFRDQIFSEQPSLKKDCSDYFNNCDESVMDDHLEPEEAEQFINEALDIRKRRRELWKEPEPPSLTFPEPLKSFTWKHLGECLISLYDRLAGKPYPNSVCSRVDLTMYEKMSPEGGIPIPVPMDTTLPVAEGLDLSELGCSPLCTPASSLVTPTPASSLTNTPLLPSTPVTPLDFTPDSTQSDATPLDISDFMKPGPKKRGPKRKRFTEEDNIYLFKRRSARVRDTGKKKQEESINYQTLLQKFLPSSLRHYQEEPDLIPTNKAVVHMDEVDGVKVDSPQSDGSSWSAEEAQEVHQFLKEKIINCGAVDLMMNYLKKLSKKDALVWPPEMTELYVNVYSRIRKHYNLPSYFFKEVSDEKIRNMGKVCLLWAEYKLDQWLLTRAKMGGSPNAARKSPAMSSLRLSPDFPGPHFNEDVSYLMGLISFPDILEDFWQKFCVRVLWLKARFYILKSETDSAAGVFNRITDFLSHILEETSVKLVVKLKNCKNDNIISNDTIQKQIESLHRCQSLEELQRLYEQEKYQKVIDLLLPTFSSSLPKGKTVAEANRSIPERHAQLLLLQDSLLKLENAELCLLWGETSINEALNCYLNVQTTDAKEEWISTMTQLFEGVEKSLSKDPSVIKTLPSKNLVRFSHNLIRVIELAMEVPEGATEMVIGTVLPWILLYRLIEHEETKLRKLQEAKGEFKQDWDMDMPSSLMLLNVAHEYLGRRSWCTNSDGALLMLFLDVVETELKRYGRSSNHPLQQDLEQALEQCLYCLYSYPNKKAKVRHLQDHNAPQVNLTWHRAILLFDYYKPKTVPEFDSYKTSTVSADLENLLRRICTLIPTVPNPPITIEMLNNYIEGSTNTPPTLPEKFTVESHVIKELYYLLADYYFKNKEQAKAIKFYLHDISVNPARFDSWAGMALARSSRLEQKLNSNELKSEVQIHKHAIAVLRCFRRALELDDSNSKLWIEYGAFAYQLHMYASRQIKLQHLFPLNEENLEIARSSRDEMLKIAQNCYIKAGQCGDMDEIEERWLHHYMLGKVAEKMHRPPSEYLDHYKEAALYLHKDNARYPKKIHYIVSPPHLAVEALEVHYRLHVSIMKYLLRHSQGISADLYKTFDQYIKAAAESPFAIAREKRHEKRERPSDVLSTTLDESSSSNLTAPTPTTPPKRGRQTYHKNPVDHDYSKQKGTDSSCEDSMDVVFSSPRAEGSSSEVESNEGCLEVSKNTSGPFSSEEEGKMEVSQKPSSQKSEVVASSTKVEEAGTEVPMDAESSQDVDPVDLEIKGVVSEILDDILDRIAVLSEQSFEGLEGAMSLKEVYNFFSDAPMWASSPRPSISSVEDSQDSLEPSSSAAYNKYKERELLQLDGEMEELALEELVKGILDDIIGKIEKGENSDQTEQKFQNRELPCTSESEDGFLNSPLPISISTPEISMETDEAPESAAARDTEDQEDIEGHVELSAEEPDEEPKEPDNVEMETQPFEVTMDEESESAVETGEFCPKVVETEGDASEKEIAVAAGKVMESEKEEIVMEDSESSQYDMDGEQEQEVSSDRVCENLEQGSRPEEENDDSSAEEEVQKDDAVQSEDGEKVKDLDEGRPESNSVMEEAKEVQEDSDIVEGVEESKDRDEEDVGMKLDDKSQDSSLEQETVQKDDQEVTESVSSAPQTPAVLSPVERGTGGMSVEDSQVAGEGRSSRSSTPVVTNVKPSNVETTCIELADSQDEGEKSEPSRSSTPTPGTANPPIDVDLQLTGSQEECDTLQEGSRSSTPASRSAVAVKDPSTLSDIEGAGTQAECAMPHEPSRSSTPHLAGVETALKDPSSVQGTCSEGKDPAVVAKSDSGPASVISDSCSHPASVVSDSGSNQPLVCGTSNVVSSNKDFSTSTGILEKSPASPSAGEELKESDEAELSTEADASDCLSKLEDAVLLMLQKCEESESAAAKGVDSAGIWGEDAGVADADKERDADISHLEDFDKIDKCLEAARIQASRSEEDMEVDDDIIVVEEENEKPGESKFSDAGLDRAKTVKVEAESSKPCDAASVEAKIVVKIEPFDAESVLTKGTADSEVDTVKSEIGNDGPDVGIKSEKVDVEVKQEKTGVIQADDSKLDFKDTESTKFVADSDKMETENLSSSANVVDTKVDVDMDTNAKSPVSFSDANMEIESSGSVPKTESSDSLSKPADTIADSTDIEKTVDAQMSSKDSEPSVRTVGSKKDLVDGEKFADGEKSGTASGAVNDSSESAQKADSTETKNDEPSKQSKDDAKNIGPQDRSDDSASTSNVLVSKRLDFEKMGDEKKSGEKDDPKKSEDISDKYNKDLLDQCIKAIHLCLSRFPTHYKSIFQLARIHFQSPWHKNITYSQDYLLGSPAWQTMSHMPSPGLFQDRKQTNFFNGIWRMPIEEIDRSGSFATHMYRSTALLLAVMKQTDDVNVLLYAHNQLQKTPEGTKKYMRDPERIALAKQAFQNSLSVIKKRLKAKARETDPDVLHLLMADVYKVWSAGIKIQPGSEDINKLLVDGFKLCKKDMVEAQPTILEQAITHCMHGLTMKTSTPSHSESRKASLSSSIDGPGSPKWRTITEEDQEKIAKLESQVGKSRSEKMPFLTKLMKEGSTSKSPSTQGMTPGQGLTLPLSKLSQAKYYSKPGPASSKIPPAAVRDHGYSFQPRSPVRDMGSSPKIKDQLRLVRPCSVRLVKSPEIHKYPVQSPPKIGPVDLSITKTAPEESKETLKFSSYPVPHFINVTQPSSSKPQTTLVKSNVARIDSGAHTGKSSYSSLLSGQSLGKAKTQKQSSASSKPVMGPLSAVSQLQKLIQSTAPKQPSVRPMSLTSHKPHSTQSFSFVRLVNEPSRPKASSSNEPYPVALLAAHRPAPPRPAPPRPTAPRPTPSMPTSSRASNPPIIEISDDSN